MPRIKLTLPGTGIPWTRVSNVLLDRLLPTLNDTELRVLLVLLRQTTGWNREGFATVMNYQNLTHRTGRQSEALSKALKELERRGLIHTVRSSPQSALRLAALEAKESEGQQYKDRISKNNRGRQVIHRRRPNDRIRK